MSGRRYWAVLWRTENLLDGKRENFMCDPDKIPSTILFRTRAEARDHIKNRYGYIAERPDLRAEPHGWKMPLAVPVTVHIRALGMP